MLKRYFLSNEEAMFMFTHTFSFDPVVPAGVCGRG